jgi:hypothetical protein
MNIAVPGSRRALGGLIANCKNASSSIGYNKTGGKVFDIRIEASSHLR